MKEKTRIRKPGKRFTTVTVQVRDESEPKLYRSNTNREENFKAAQSTDLSGQRKWEI